MPVKKQVDFRTRYGRSLKRGWQSFSRQLDEELWVDDGVEFVVFCMKAGQHKRLMERMLRCEPIQFPLVTLLQKQTEARRMQRLFSWITTKKEVGCNAG